MLLLRFYISSFYCFYGAFNGMCIFYFEITDLFMKKLEAKIRKEPAYYFWTHKRFKYMKTE